jgi:hypothetical protein
MVERLTTNQEAAGSSPAKVAFFTFLQNKNLKTNENQI